MKRILLCAALYLSLLLYSCTPIKKETYIIGVSQCSEDSWRNQMNNEILQEAKFYGDVEVIFKSANDNNQLQIEQIDEFVNNNVDLIIVAPNEMEALTPTIEHVYDSGIPIIVVDRNISSQKYTSKIGANNYDIGYLAGQYAINRLNGKGNILEISGLKGSSAAVERHKGFAEAISKCKDIKLLSSVDASWSTSDAQHITDSLLKGHSDVDLVYGHNDKISYGAYLAAKQAGRERDIIFVGVDALPGKNEGINLVEKGILDASLIYPTAGNIAMQTAYKILTGESYQRNIVPKTSVINKSNVRLARLQAEQVEMLDSRINALNVRVVSHLERISLQRQQLWVVIVAIIMFIITTIWITASLISKQKLNKILKDQNIKIKGQNKELEQQQDQLRALANQLEEATQSKLVFFTNISHDFRTPLTLIADPIHYLIEETPLNDEQKSILNLADKNIAILQRLMNQILDFRSYENGKLQLSTSRFDLSEKVSEWINTFHSSAKRLGKRIIFSREHDDVFVIDADQEKIERVFYNLLSNALKNSITNSIISIKLRSSDGYLSLQISNVCNNITQESIKNIFDRFYKVNLSSDGSGIGLAIAKAYIELHQGSISVDYNPDEMLFEIEVKIPVVSQVEITKQDKCQNTNIAFIEESTQDIDTAVLTEELDSDAASNKPLVLVVDDNEDILEYVSMQLKKHWQIITATNGKEGYKLAIKQIPDVIISDVMMPIMDGMELCKKLKEDVITCHIPVVMLTACAVDEQRIAGYTQGADSYISKPFSIKLLKTRIENLIENRQLSSNKTSNVRLREECTNDEKLFVDKFYDIVNSKLEDPDLSIDDIASEINYSRVQLYRKIKALTGESPSKLLQNARLTQADLLLRTTQRTISEIAYEVGFTSPSYFSKSYKSFFGISPRDMSSAVK